MKTANWGRIINIASAHALVASPFKSAYVAAKHGLASMTKTVALEVAEQGITVNAICPGYVLTPLVERQISDTARARGITEEEVRRDVILAAQPTRQFVGIDEVAGLAVYLCSASARSITGATLSVLRHVSGAGSRCIPAPIALARRPHIGKRNTNSVQEYLTE